LLIDYSSAVLSHITEADFSDDLYLIVSTEQDISNGTITASEVLFINETLEVGIYYEIEGLISRLGETLFVDGFTLLSDDTTDDFLELSLDQFSVGEPVFVVARRTDASTHYFDSEANNISSSAFFALIKFPLLMR